MSYTYDALYRLVRATGREQIGIANFGSSDNYNDSAWMGIAHKGNDNNTQNYIQKYTYDEVGNILSLQHIADTASYTRNYTYDTASNRLLSTAVGANTYNYSYDNRGNMVSMPHLTAMQYNSQNQLSAVDLGGGGDAYYQYSGGERSRKVIINGAIIEERIYLGSYEIYRKFVSSSLTLERITVHVADDTGRIAMLEIRTIGTDPSPATLVRYIYSNNQGTSCLELDDTAAIISYEEYHPFGTTSYQAKNASINATAKRYRYTGKERDEESGLNYHGARYYLPWLGRWCACEPLNSCLYILMHKKEKYEPSSLSSYSYCKSNPINFIDTNGEFLVYVGWVISAVAIDFVAQVIGNYFSGKKHIFRVDIADLILSGIGALLSPIGQVLISIFVKPLIDYTSDDGPVSNYTYKSPFLSGVHSKSLTETAWDMFGGTVGSIIGHAGKIAERIGGPISKGLSSMLKTSVEGTINNLTNKGKSDTSDDPLGNAWRKLKANVNNALAKADYFLTHTVANWWNNIVDKVSEWFNKAINKIANIFRSKFNIKRQHIGRLETSKMKPKDSKINHSNPNPTNIPKPDSPPPPPPTRTKMNVTNNMG